jgi:hypothetical protein
MASVSTAASVITVNTAGPRGPVGNTGPRGHAGTTNISSSLSNIIVTGSLWISGSSHLGTGHITASGNISASGNIIASNVYLPGPGIISFDDSLDGTDQLISGNDNNIIIDADNVLKLRADESIEFQDTNDTAQVTINPNAGHITASGNISASYTSTGSFGSIQLNNLPTSDPGTAGFAFVTGSAGMSLGSITGSGFSLLCISNG